MCVKAGMHHWARLYRAHPDRYRRAEREEGRLRDLLGDVSILTDRTGEKKRPLPLSEFRQRLEDRCSLPFEDDGGGCGCALETEDTATEPVADTKPPGPGPRPYPAPEPAPERAAQPECRSGLAADTLCSLFRGDDPLIRASYSNSSGPIPI